MTSLAAAPLPVRVACVGDSITYGDQIADRKRDAYPAVLERLSNGRFHVGNFGVNGATAIAAIPFRSWSDTRACQEALAFTPAVVVIMLGVNDTAFPNLHNRYPDDLRRLVERFQSLASTPRLYLCTLTPIAAAAPDAPVNQTIRETLNPAIRAVAAQTGADVIDISPIFADRADLFPDGLHPNAAGAELIARTVLATLDETRTPATALQPGAVPGPVARSIGHEARAAHFRASQWLQDHPVPDDLADPATAWEGHDLRVPDDIADLLPLLRGVIPDTTPDPYYAYATLATALARIGHDTVFLDADHPVAWREALLHQLVQQQRIDARGRGFWGRGDDPAALARATTYALHALTAAGLTP
ncbi:MAG: GDSL-type esterase/lipase family protein [Kiritimatiellae bacterium]|nr:GDSL-type esterase/lipase family protein [Kiritimatiellia bacterium]